MSMHPQPTIVSPPPPPDLASIAAALHETATALQSFCKVPNPSEAVDDAPCDLAPRDSKRDAADLAEQTSTSGQAPTAGAVQGEIRCYHFSPLAVRCERELLETQGVHDFHELLYNASSSITMFTALLELMDAETAIDGPVIHILARELKRIENMLFKMQDAYSTVTLVEA